MLQNLLSATLFIFVCLAIYRFHPQILGVLKRFDAQNRARIEDEVRDRRDGVAHFRHTLALAEEQVEQVSPVTVSDERTAQPVTRYVFEGETFANERDAQRTRADRVRDVARGFYVELPAALVARREDDKLGR